MNREQLIMMNYFMRYTDAEGEWVVTRQDIANLWDCTVVTAKNRVQSLIELGYVVEHKKLIKIGSGYKYIYHITDKGDIAIRENFKRSEAFYWEYRQQKLQRAMELAIKKSKPRGTPKKVSDNQKVLL